MYIGLAAFRESYHTAISSVYSTCCKIAERVETDSLVVARLKRYPTIRNKMIRFPSMKMSQLDDIAGCRIILKNIESIYLLVERLKSEKSLSVLKEKDYIKDPRDSGYKSLHLIVSDTATGRKVEIQIRTYEHHSWSTLVEITDTIFETNLKEMGLPVPFFNALRLLSKPIHELSEKDLEEIVKHDKDNNYLERVMETFIHNIQRSSELWKSTKPNPNKEYFLISVKDRNEFSIRSYLSAKKAEREYLQSQLENPDSNCVLIHMKDPNFTGLLRAYSNYVLVGNDLVLNYHYLLYTLIKKKIDRKRYIGFITYFIYLRSVIASELDWFLNYSESSEELNSINADESSIYFRKRHEDRVMNALAIIEKIRTHVITKKIIWLILFEGVQSAWYKLVHKENEEKVNKIKEYLKSRQEEAPDFYSVLDQMK